MVGSAIALGAVGLLWFGVQGVVVELDRLPPSQLVETRSSLIEAGRGDEARALRDMAIDMFEDVPESSLKAEDTRRWAGVHVSAARHAFDERKVEEALQHLQATKTLATASLGANPVHPLSWAYLAEARMSQGDAGALEDGYRLLKASYAMAPVEPDYFNYRFGLALAAPEFWEVDFLRALRRDFSSVLAQGHWRPAVRAFISLAKIDGPGLSGFQTFWSAMIRRCWSIGNA